MSLGSTYYPTALGGSMAAIVFGCTALAQTAAAPTSAEVVTRMLQSEREQEKNLQYYRLLRDYQLRNDDGSKAVKVTAAVSYNSNGLKTIQVIQESGSEGIFRRVIRKVLDTEVTASREDGRREMRMSPENYDFKLVGSEVRDGRQCYVLQLLPKRKSKYLIDGKLWVDAQDAAIVRVEGRPAASLSFWVGKPYITQSFEKVGTVWLMSRNESLTNAKLIGKVTFTMETREVQSGNSKVALRHPEKRGITD